MEFRWRWRRAIPVPKSASSSNTWLVPGIWHCAWSEEFRAVRRHSHFFTTAFDGSYYEKFLLIKSSEQDNAQP